MARRLLALLTLVVALAATVAAPAGAAAPKTTLPDVEDEVMCVSCDVALNTAESPQAYRQRELIRDLIAQGLTKEQIKDRLVAEYGKAVLAMPDEGGFGIAAYLVPIAVVLALVAAAALVLPRWRRRTPAAGPAPALAGGAVTDAELQRLEQDLQRYDRS